MSACLYLMFSEDGQVAGLGQLALTDGPAAQAAERLLHADRDTRRVEIWQGDRLLAVAG